MDDNIVFKLKALTASRSGKGAFLWRNSIIVSITEVFAFKKIGHWKCRLIIVLSINVHNRSNKIQTRLRNKLKNFRKIFHLLTRKIGLPLQKF